MAASKLQINWSSVSHGNTTITRVNNVSFSKGAQLITYKGDDNVYPVAAVNVSSMPKATVTTSDPATLMGIAPGTTATFAATHKDALGAASGGIAYSLANAVAESGDTSGAHAQFGTGSISFIGVSTDGTTNPLSFTRV